MATVFTYYTMDLFQMLNTTSEILKMANGAERLENIKPSPIFLALELELSHAIVQKLIDNGAQHS